jgi:hypothetical protein
MADSKARTGIVHLVPRFAPETVVDICFQVPDYFLTRGEGLLGTIPA